MLNDSHSKMNLLIHVIQDLSLARSIEQIQDIVKHAARQLVGSDGTTFVIREDNMCYYVDEDAISPLWKGQKFNMDICISGWVMKNKQTVIIEDIYKDDRIPINAYRTTFVKSLIMVPIRTLEPIGAIGNYWQNTHLPTSEEIKMLEALANSTSIAMENVRFYSELEHRVEERTTQLSTINNELEAFTYSVSHDLRSPLTIIGGLSQMINQDTKNEITSDSRFLFSRLEYNIKRMNDLIDALLRLSRISQSSVNKKEIDISALAKEILTECLSQQPERIIKYTIESSLKTYGDAKLIHVLLENLIDNAIKFTAKNVTTELIIGGFIKEGHQVIFIKDNGAGFNVPEDKEQLFRPFKRFHNQDEFPGTGIGHAICKRIIRLHGGELWAESSPNEGATFYFYLA